MIEARRGKFQLVIVWALDRLCREGSAAILNRVNTLKSYGVKVISYQESWTEAPGEVGELLYAIVGWVAQMESQRRSERTKAGIAVKRKQRGKVRKAGTWGRQNGSTDTKTRKRRKAKNVY